MGAATGRVALICPGQGAQRAGGVAGLAAALRPTFDRASAAISLDLWKAGLDSTPEQLARPSVLQPFLVAWAVAEVERARATRAGLPHVDYCLGHSSGENSALVLSGALSLEDGVRFAFERGKHLDLISDEPESGLLALSGVDRKRAEAIGAATASVLANHNGTEQAVLGGPAAALERVVTLAEGQEVEAVRLQLAGAFHTEVCRRSDDLTAPIIDTLPIHEPFTPVIGNARGQLISDAAGLRAELRDQYTRPVEWLAALQAAYDLGVRTALVTGPGNTMAGLVRRFNRTRSEPIRVVRLAPGADGQAGAP